MIIKTNVSVGDVVYVYTKKGLERAFVFELFISVNSKGTRESFRIEEHGDLYWPGDVVAKTPKHALTAIRRNEQQLQLTLEA